MSKATSIPRNKENDHTREQSDLRRTFIQEKTGAKLDAVASYTIDAEVTRGNIENFIGAIQVPVGVAGPITINGEHAKGEFYVPLATTEGTLVASYSRGMRVISECGGVKTTVAKHSMQRAPVFIFEDALQAREFGGWLRDNFEDIKKRAESTTSTGKLIEIEQYAVANMLYTRFDYTTGDAAGQNMTGKATYAACEWISSVHPSQPKYILSGSIDTDKKHSAMNMIQTRGKRVIAEVTLKKDVVKRLLRVDTETLFRFRQISNAGSMQAGSVYNSAHSANAIAALFIATGQDEANVVESHAGITYAQLLENGDYYWSVTLPAVISATYGGGTGLPTQRECLEMLGCYGAGKSDKFAEIIAAVVLAGDISLASAILAGDWVSSHEELGRNR
jgi:hydroxymethylglutaryl-CoA reductase (NADPH)